MKIVLLLLTFLICETDADCQPVQQAAAQNIDIHKSKREFVSRPMRRYLKNKAIRNPHQNHMKSVDDLIRSGNQKVNVRDYKGALRDFNEALELEPTNTEARYYCGYMKFQMEDFGNAITEYNTAIEIDTESVELFYFRGNAKFKLKDFRGAFDDYTKAISLDSLDKESYYNRGVARYNLGENEPACKDMQKAFKLGDKDADVISREWCKTTEEK